ncbi:hypothetical protein [Sphingobium nicotianae]|uniref:Uncharacterized protein n=1 Tax=Sphingobium nicotianae TaxID=2782607 RepID=A0A9X1IRR1_9SPHN|nr:hypothetical protein [Sphingobium nicotianae]MBT2187544.1 hypothetical protein [Sphingobium nicotianae]
MRLVISLAMLAAFSGISSPSLSAEDQAQPAPKEEKKVCRREEVSGSIVPKRTCHTKAEWEAIDKAVDAYTNGAIDRRRHAQGSHNDPSLTP